MGGAIEVGLEEMGWGCSMIVWLATMGTWTGLYVTGVGSLVVELDG